MKNFRLSAGAAGVLGAGGGYMIGANRDRLAGNKDNRSAAQAVVDQAKLHPATVGDVGRAATAARLSDGNILERLTVTGHVFELIAIKRA